MTSPERLSLTELDRRMALFDPFLPRAEVLAGLTALHEALDEVAVWRRVGLACVAVALVCVTVTSVVLAIGSSQASELLVYEKRCMTPEAAEVLIETISSVTSTNSTCLALHQKDREFMQAMFAKSDAIYKAADKAGFMYAIGDNTYEDVPELPDSKATDFFLHGEEPGRRAGVVVQAVQQSKP